jgi:nicotinate-nucleotide pyrophosphorylase (carboxylating)
MKITAELKIKLKAALAEDIGKGDITSELLIPEFTKGEAVILAREPGVFCGEAVTREVFRLADSKIKITFRKKDGQSFKKNGKLLEIKGPIHGILKGERVALNFLGHLCGIASKTQAFVRRANGVRILDTRKTTPLWRELEKYAVKCGGGSNHRMGLYDAIFVKENHRHFGNLSALKVHAKNFEIEVRNLREVTEALMLSPRVILFDNFSPDILKKAVSMVRRIHPKIVLEASGGINLENVKVFARTGVDQISAGSLTHSVKAIDLSLLLK